MWTIMWTTMMAHSAWTNRTVELYNRGITYTEKAILIETWRGANTWVHVISVVYWTLTSAYRETLQ